MAKGHRALSSHCTIECRTTVSQKLNKMNGFAERGRDGDREGMTFIDMLELARARAREQAKDPWLALLENLQGKKWDDGVERISTQTVFDLIDVPPSRRTSQACRRLAVIMAELGWAPIRFRGLNSKGYRDQIRGWAREIQ